MWYQLAIITYRGTSWLYCTQLKRHALISVVRLCKAGCKVHFKHNFRLILNEEKLVMYGIRCPSTEHWMVLLKHQNLQRIKAKSNNLTNSKFSINNFFRTSLQQQLIEYLHQCFFSPTKPTLLKAIKNNNLLGVPGLTEQAGNKYLLLLTATIKGHVHHTRTNLCSTRKLKEIEDKQHKQDITPQQRTNSRNRNVLLCCSSRKMMGTIYPAWSYKGNCYIS